MKRTVSRWLGIIVVANLVLGVLLVTALTVGWLQSRPFGHPVQSEAPPSASPEELMPMGLAHIPTGNSCLLCHDTGGEAGLKPIPALGHPVEGWLSCTVCHTDERLGRKAPGHAGIPQKECLNCHKVAPPGPAITQPHSRLQDQHCLDCHGDVAHLPSSMVGRNQDECWLCHQPAASPPPQKPHPDTERLTCRSCHASPETGGLPIDHALRDDDTCKLCHDVPLPSPAPGSAKPTAVPPASPAASEGNPPPTVSPAP
jgi:hypothetical protein